MVSISMKNWSFDVFCGLCIFVHLRLQTSFLWRWKMAVFCMIYLLRICRFMAKKSPKYIRCIKLFCHFAKLSIPKTQLCTRTYVITIIILPFYTGLLHTTYLTHYDLLNGGDKYKMGETIWWDHLVRLSVKTTICVKIGGFHSLV